MAEGTSHRCVSLLDTDKPSSDVTSWIVCLASGTYLLRACGLNAPSSPIPGVGLGGLVARTESAVLGGLPFTSADYCDFRTHGPHTRIDSLSALSGRYVARVSASVATVDRCLGRGRALPAADNDSLWSSPYSLRSARTPQKPMLPRRPSPSRLLQGVLHRGLTRSRPRASPRPPLPCRALRVPRR